MPGRQAGQSPGPCMSLCRGGSEAGGQLGLHARALLSASLVGLHSCSQSCELPASHGGAGAGPQHATPAQTTLAPPPSAGGPPST